jgi:hypothetical protein
MNNKTKIDASEVEFLKATAECNLAFDEYMAAPLTCADTIKVRYDEAKAKMYAARVKYLTANGETE